MIELEMISKSGGPGGRESTKKKFGKKAERGEEDLKWRSLEGGGKARAGEPTFLSKRVDRYLKQP